MTNCDKGRHDYGSGEAFCLLCAEPNPRCVTCGRHVAVQPSGSTRCVKGHVHALKLANPRCRGARWQRLAPEPQAKPMSDWPMPKPPPYPADDEGKP